MDEFPEQIMSEETRALQWFELLLTLGFSLPLWEELRKQTGPGCSNFAPFLDAKYKFMVSFNIYKMK